MTSTQASIRSLSFHNSRMQHESELQVISGRLERGEIDTATYLEQLLRFIARRIACSRAGLRVLVEAAEGRALPCVAMFDASLDRMVAANGIVHAEADLYLSHLQRDGSVVANRAGTGDAIAEALPEYFESANIGSLMDMGFSVNGVLFGAFTCEQVGAPVEWTQRQFQALRKIASRASLTLMHVVNAAVDTTPGALWDTSTPNRLTTMVAPLDVPSE